MVEVPIKRKSDENKKAEKEISLEGQDLYVLMHSLQDSLSNVHSELKSHSERLISLEMQKQRPLQQEKIQISTTNSNDWNLVAFGILWPFITFAFLDFMQTK